MLVKLYTTNKTLENYINQFITYHNIKGDSMPRYKNSDTLKNDICVLLYNVSFIHDKTDSIITLHFNNISIDILKSDVIEYVIQMI